MTALEFQASLNADGTVKVPHEMAEQLKHFSSFRVLVLVPQDNEDETDDEAWRRLGLTQFFKGYSDSDAIYDDL